MTSIYRTAHTVQITTGQATLTLDIPEAQELLAQLARALAETSENAEWYMQINRDAWRLPRPTSTAAPLDEPLIGAAEAQTIARNMYKLRIPKSTLISAYPPIDGAQKVGGRWKGPPGNFREWLDTWASKQ